MSGNQIDLAPLLPAIEAGRLILVPNHRSREAILDCLVWRSDHPVRRTARVYAIDIWLRELWQQSADMGLEPCCSRHPLDAHEEHLIWLMLVEKSLAQTPLLDPEDTAVSLSRSYQLYRQWFLAPEQQQSLAAYGGIHDVGAFLNWMRQYQAYCDSKQRVSLVDLTWLLVDALEDGELVAEPDIVLVNFYQPPPLYDRLFDSLGCGETQRLFTHGAVTPATRQRYQYSDIENEIAASADWAATLRSSNKPLHIGIIIPANEAYLASVERGFRATLPEIESLNLSTDASAILRETGNQDRLLQQGPTQAALALLGLHQDLQDSNRFCQLLASPFIRGADAEREARLQLQLWLRNRGNRQLRLSHVLTQMQDTDRSTYCPLLGDLLLRLRRDLRAAPKSRLPQDWIDLLRRLLLDAGWPGTALTDRERQILRQWNDCLEALGSSAQALGKLSFESLLSRLRSLCNRTLLVPRVDPSCPVALYTPEQALGMGLTHAWVLGLDDQTWPAPAAPDPFLPYQLQRELGMPGAQAETRQADAARVFDLLQHSVSDALIFSHHCFNEESQLRPAECIAQFPLVAAPPLRNTAPVPGVVVLETVADQTALPLSDAEPASGDSGLIGRQSSCPFRAFANYRLRVEPLDEFRAGLNAAARGIAVHKALEFFWSRIASSAQLETLDEFGLQALVSEAATSATDYLHFLYPDVMTPAFRSLEQHRLEQLLELFLTEERRRAPFTVQSLEQKLDWRRGNLQLRLKSDRIDVLADGSLALLDYKSGRQGSNPAAWLEDRPQDLQLPLYHYAVSTQQSQPISAVAVAQVNVEKTGFTGFWSGEQFHSATSSFSKQAEAMGGWPALQQRWHQKIDALADEYLAGQLCVTPAHREKSCQYCGLQGLCRIGELDGGTIDDDDEPGSANGPVVEGGGE